MKHRGIVVMYRYDKSYGFIRPDDGGADLFFTRDEVLEDQVGRRHVIVGLPVEFEIGSGVRPSIFRRYNNLPEDELHARIEKAGQQSFAENIRSLWAGENIDPTTYREASVITRMSQREREHDGLARRPDGGTVYVDSSAVITEGVLGVGARIWHGVKPPTVFGDHWVATNIEIFTPCEVPCEAPCESGTIYTYDSKKGFGFIACGGRDGQRTDQDVFFHACSIPDADLIDLVGRNVQFKLNADVPSRPRAYDISIEAESWSPKDVKTIPQNVVSFPTKSILLTDRFKGVPLRKIRRKQIA